MDNILVYRRQFLLTNDLIHGLDNWQHHNVDNVHLLVHPDLEITIQMHSRILLILLGYIFDPNHPQYDNHHIISSIIQSICSFDDLIAAINPLAGRYAIIYKDATHFKIVNDPLGLREIYYCTQPNRVICGSQPNLLDAFSEPQLGITTNNKILRFYTCDMKLVRSGRLWVGDDTYYNSVKHLMPNHYLNIHTLLSHRYWPNRTLHKIDPKIAVKKSCEYLKGVLKAVTTRYDVMMAVTSGTDSRSLLAASRDVKDKIHYFINKEPPLNMNSRDIRIPQAIFKHINVPFHVNHVEDYVDETFTEVFLDNVFMSTPLLLSTIYNVYYKNYQNKVNLLGVGEIGREYYGNAPSDIDGYYLARCLKYKQSEYAISQCDRWLREVRDIAKACDIDIMKLFLWEVLLGNWGVVGNSESDIAIEEFDPYDSHYIYEVLLSTNIKQGDIFENIIIEMWPELLDFPFNPPETTSDWIKHLLMKVGVFKHMKMAIYRFDRLRYKRLKLLKRPDFFE